MCITICGRFRPDEGAVAGYSNQIRVKYTAKRGVQIAGMIFQTGSRSNYSPSYLTKIFCQVYGCTPSKYLITLRMSHAQRLLVHEPGLSVKQIGEMCGYHDQGYFSRIFKKHTGKSPLEFRG